MEPQHSDFAEEFKRNPKAVGKYKKAENLHYGFFLVAILLLLVLGYYRSTVEGWFPSAFPYSEYAFLIPASICFLLSIIGWRAKRKMDITSEDIAQHYLALSIENFESRKPDKTTEYLNDFKTEATKSSNDLFSGQTKSRIEKFVDQLEDDSDNEEILEEKFNQFITTLRTSLGNQETFEEIVSSSPESKTEEATSSEVILEGLNNPNIDRYLISQVISIIISLYIFYFVNEQLAMFLIIASLSIIPQIKESQH